LVYRPPREAGQKPSDNLPTTQVGARGPVLAVVSKPAETSLSGLVRGFLFSFQAEGKAAATIDYYRRPLQHLERYALHQGWQYQ